MNGFMKVNGLKTKNLEIELLFIRMEVNMLESGRMALGMDLKNKLMLMEAFMKVNGLREKIQELELT